MYTESTNLLQRYRNIHTGELVRVKQITRLRTLLLSLNTGERRWIENSELAAAWRPALPYQRER